MRFESLGLAGAYLIHYEPKMDERGFFSRAFCVEELGKQCLETGIAQCNMSYNLRAGTIRGMHYQIAPREETKVVICTQGAIFDVVVDLRPESKTAGKWFGVMLRALELKAIYVPRGFAHGYLSLVDCTSVFYIASACYNADCERTLLWNDPEVGIRWPVITTQRGSVKPGDYIVSEKDKNADNLKKCLRVAVN